MMKRFFFVFSVFVLVLSFSRLPGASAEDPYVERYSRSRVPLDQAVLRYHNDMNSLFNEHIEKLFSIDPDGKTYVVKPPEDQNCGSAKNISTYCLSMRALDRYDAFVRAMDTHRGYLKEQADNSTKTINELLGASERRLDLINEQVLQAERVMSTTLAAYDQLQTMYPLHVQYQELLGELEQYRDGLADVRREVEHYPGSFQNVTTADCT